MATQRDVLILEFQTPHTVRRIRVTDPKEDLTSSQVQAAMQTLADLNALEIFIADGGNTNLKGAKKVSTVTDKFDIVVE